MNLDIIQAENGSDLGLAVTAVAKAANVVGTQVGTLEYAPNFGVDLKFFVDTEFQFQNSSFKAYLVERLTAHQINVTGVPEVLETLNTQYTFYVDNQNVNSKGFVK